MTNHAGTIQLYCLCVGKFAIRPVGTFSGSVNLRHFDLAFGMSFGTALGSVIMAAAPFFKTEKSTTVHPVN